MLPRYHEVDPSGHYVSPRCGSLLMLQSIIRCLEITYRDIIRIKILHDNTKDNIIPLVLLLLENLLLAPSIDLHLLLKYMLALVEDTEKETLGQMFQTSPLHFELPEDDLARSLVVVQRTMVDVQALLEVDEG